MYTNDYYWVINDIAYVYMVCKCTQTYTHMSVLANMSPTSRAKMHDYFSPVPSFLVQGTFLDLFSHSNLPSQLLRKQRKKMSKRTRCKGLLLLKLS